MDNNPELALLAKKHGWIRESNGCYRGECPVKDHKTNKTTRPLVVSSGRSHSIIAYCHACKGNREAILEALGIHTGSITPNDHYEPIVPEGLEGEEVLLEQPTDPEREKKKEVAGKIWSGASDERSDAAKLWLTNKGKLPQEYLKFVQTKETQGQLIFPILSLETILTKDKSEMKAQGVCVRFIDQMGMPREDQRGLRQRTYGWSAGGATLLSHSSFRKLKPSVPVIICEGIADGISLFGLIQKQDSFGMQVPILVMHGTAGIRKLRADPTTPLYFFSDRGEAGEYSSFLAARNHARRGGLTRIYLPKRDYAKDPNEAVVPHEPLDDLFYYVTVGQR